MTCTGPQRPKLTYGNKSRLALYISFCLTYNFTKFLSNLLAWQTVYYSQKVTLILQSDHLFAFPTRHSSSNVHCRYSWGSIFQIVSENRRNNLISFFLCHIFHSQLYLSSVLTHSQRVNWFCTPPIGPCIYEMATFIILKNLVFLFGLLKYLIRRNLRKDEEITCFVLECIFSISALPNMVSSIGYWVSKQRFQINEYRILCIFKDETGSLIYWFLGPSKLIIWFL